MKRAAFNKCNVTIAEVIKKEKPEYVLPDFISYPSSEDECGNLNETRVPKRKKKSSKVISISPEAPVLLTNNSGYMSRLKNTRYGQMNMCYLLMTLIQINVSFLQRTCLRTTHVLLKRL
jgi:hypothetical protein